MKRLLIKCTLFSVFILCAIAVRAQNNYGSVGLYVGEEETVFISSAMQNVLNNPYVTVTKYSWTSASNSVQIVNSSYSFCKIKGISEISGVRLNYHVEYTNAVGTPIIDETYDAYFTVTVSNGSNPNTLTLTASPSGGMVSQGTKVYLTASISGAMIYYTLDGSTPDKNSSLYLSSYPPEIENSCTLKAIAYAGTYSNPKTSNIITETYTVIEESGTYFTVKNAEGYDISYQIASTSPKTCIVRGKPEYEGDDKKSATSTYPKGTFTIPSYANGYKVTGIYDWSFQWGKNITAFVLPNTLQSIGEWTFWSCEKLASITFPSSLKSIGSLAFDGCKSISSITIPSSVTSIGGSTQYIGDNPFVGCSALSSISVETGNSVYDSRGNCNAIIKTGTNTLIVGCKNTYIPNSVTAIGDYAFGESEIMTIDIPESVQSIGKRAFYSCRNLTSANIPSAVTRIEKQVFDNCTSLQSIIIPQNVVFIGESAFRCCSALSSISVESGNTVYDSRGNSNAIIETATNKLIVGCQNTIIPKGVAEIGTSAFDGCSFLKEIKIPSSVNTIGSFAFYDCSSLTAVYVNKETPISIGRSTFSNRANCTLYIPVGSKSAYEGANYWKDFKEIVEIDIRNEQTLAMTEIPAMKYGDVAYSLPLKTTEGLPLTWSVDNENVANVSGNTLSIVGAGMTSISAIQIGNDEYESFSREFTLTVNKATLTVTADNKTKQEGEVNPELTVTYSGFVNGDNASSLTTQPTVTTTATKDSPVGTYPITASGASSVNYTFNYVNGTLTVTEKPAQPTIEVTDISLLDDAIYIEPLEGRIGDDVIIEVRLKNAEAVTSYGFELVLPMDMSIDVTTDGDFDDEVTLSTRHNKHTVTTNLQSDGSYKVAVASMSSKTLTGNDGVVLTIVAHIADNMAVGDYPIMVKNPLVVYGDATKPAVQPTQTIITIEDYIKGDVDSDGVVDLADAVLVINHYVGKPVTVFNAKAADVDGDGVIDLADAVLIINYYVGKIPSLSRSIDKEELEAQ